MNRKELLKLVFGGMPLGFIGSFYYWSIQYIPVSVAVVLLMHSIWISVVLEAIIDKKIPDAFQISAILIVHGGTSMNAHFVWICTSRKR